MDPVPELARGCFSSSSEKWLRKRSRTPARCVGRARASSASPSSVSTAKLPRPSDVARVAHDQALALEPVDEPRDAGAAEQHAVGQLGHAQAPVGRGLQVDQDVVRGKREVVRRRELGVELAHERRVDPQQPAPRAELERVSSSSCGVGAVIGERISTN